MSKLIEGREDNFETEVLGSEVPVIVDFYADWCQPCRRLAPVLEKLSEKVGDSARIVKVNVETETALAEAYRIRSLPTIAFFKDGEVVSQTSGIMSLEALEAKLAEI